MDLLVIVPEPIQVEPLYIGANGSGYFACLAAFRSPRVTAWKPALMDAAVRLAPHRVHSTMVSRVEGSFRSIVAADLHISQVTYSLMYLGAMRCSWPLAAIYHSAATTH